jgi:hypothetical protein
LNLRREDAVLDLLVGKDDDQHDDRGPDSFFGPEGGHEDEAGDGRADVRDHVEEAGDHPEPERVARAEDPGGRSLHRPGDGRDDDDPDGPARDRLGDALPDVQPALVFTRSKNARERLLQVPDVREQEETDEEDREGGEEDSEEVSRDPEHRRDRVGDRDRDLLGARLYVPGSSAVS